MSNTYFLDIKQQHDSFESGTITYYVTNVALLVYGLGVIASLTLLNNATVLYTYTLGNNYGTLYSDRFVTQWWWALFFNGTRVAHFLCVCSMLLFRKTAKWCNVAWWILMAFLFMLDVAALFMLSGYLGTCNGDSPGNWNNPCNSYNWCCDPRIYSRPENHCRPTSACPVGQAQTLEAMLPNADFLWLFVLNIVSVIFHLYFLALPMFNSCSAVRNIGSALDKARERFSRDLWLGGGGNSKDQ
jgi:hypothetical protein